MEHLLRCTHQIGPVDLFGEVDTGAPSPVFCNALALFVNADGAPRCAHPQHGQAAPMGSAQLVTQSAGIAALLEHIRPAVADAHVASMILHGTRVTMADIAFCSASFRASLMAAPMATLREQAAKVVQGIAAEVLASESVSGLCNTLSDTGELCSLPEGHPRALGDNTGGDWHVTFRIEKTTFRGWALPNPEETGWIWESKRDGLWFTMGPRWTTKVLPRPIGYHAVQDIRAIFSGPDAVCLGVLEAIRTILPRGERMGLTPMIDRLAPLTGQHPLLLIAAVMALTHRGDLSTSVDAIGWPEDLHMAKDAPTRALTRTEAQLLLRASKPEVRTVGVSLTARTLGIARRLQELNLGSVSPRPIDDRLVFTISDAGLARSGRTP